MNLDPKLVASIVAAGLSWLVVKIGLSVDDPNVAAAISLAVAAAVSYFVPNDGTVLRTVQEDGNPVIPDGA